MPKQSKEKNDELNIKISKTTNKKSKSLKEKEITNKSSKSNTKKKTSSKTSSKKAKVVPTSIEYYDLPFRYNQTVVKILSQTPNTLFIYWDISDKDKKLYIEEYGKDFFETTKPYLFIKNVTMNYSFEVEINDFANSWYLHTNDENCEYKVELIRKYITNSNLNNSISIVSSNEIETPNNHILFDKLGNSVFFKNVKTDFVEEKNISSISFLQKIGQVYNIYDLYKEMYKDELISDEFELNLPSSSKGASK